MSDAERTDEKDAVGTPGCGHTMRPCTDARTWCPECGTPPCCHHVERADHPDYRDGWKP